MEPELEENIAWRHVMEGRYDQALAIYARLIPQAYSRGDWNNYGTALLLNGDLHGAEQAYRHTRQLPDPVGITNVKVGAALWCQGKSEEACVDWQQEIHRIKSTRLRYYDGSLILFTYLLWWASLRMEAPALTKTTRTEMRRKWRILTKHAKKWGIKQWSLFIGDWIFGEISAEEFLLSAAGTLDLEGKQLGFGQCLNVTQAYFYLASRYPPHSELWRSDLESAVRYGAPRAIVLPEYHIAKYELSKL